MFRPLNDSVVVEPVKAEANLNGVILTESANQQYHGLRAVVIAVGPGLYTLSGTRLSIDLKEGDVVILRTAGPLIREGGRVYAVVSERDVLAVVEGGPPVKPYSRAEHTPRIVETLPLEHANIAGVQ